MDEIQIQAAVTLLNAQNVKILLPPPYGEMTIGQLFQRYHQLNTLFDRAVKGLLNEDQDRVRPVEQQGHMNGLEFFVVPDDDDEPRQ